MVTFSIIVPVFNSERYLNKCVTSLLNQTYSDFELILIDDGSTDKCKDICNHFSIIDKRVITIHKQNGGVSSARNEGLKIARGKYVAFCDSDDYVEEKWLETMYSKIKDTDIDAASFGFINIDEKDRVISSWIPKQRLYCIDSQLDYLKLLIKSLTSYDFKWGVWLWVFNMKLIKENSIYFYEILDYAEDMCFLFEYLLYCKKVLISDYCGYYYLTRGDSIIGKSRGTIKLNSLNEVSFKLGTRISSGKFYVIYKRFYIIHFLVMYNQYSLLLYSELIGNIQEETKKIIKKSWYNHWTKKTLFNFSSLRKEFGRNTALRIINISFLFFSKSVFFYKIVNRIIARRFLSKDDGYYLFGVI